MSKNLLSISNKSGKTNLLGIFGTVFSSSVIFFGSQFIAGFLLVVILILFGFDSENITSLLSNNSLVQLFYTLLAAIIGSFIIFKLVKWLTKNKTKEFLLLKNLPNKNQLLEIVLIFGAYFLTLILVTVAVDLLTPVNVSQEQDLGLADPTSFLSGLALFVMIVIITPLYEELLFRGLLFNALKSFTKYLIAFAITSILFGVAHLEYENLNWIAAIDTLVFSGFLICISQKHQSLYSAVLLHAIKNAIAFYVVFV